MSTATTTWTPRIVQYEPDTLPAIVPPMPPRPAFRTARRYGGHPCYVCGHPIRNRMEAIRRKLSGGKYVFHCPECIPIPALLRENAFEGSCCACGAKLPIGTGLAGPIESGDLKIKGQWLFYCWDDAPLGVDRKQMLAMIRRRAESHGKRFPGFDVERFMRHAKYRPTRFLHWAINEPIAASSKVFRKSRKARASLERWARSDD
jgi:hypothetical protein